MLEGKIIQKKVKGTLLYYPMVKFGECAEWEHVMDWNPYTRRWKHYKCGTTTEAAYMLTIQGIKYIPVEVR